MRVSALFLLAFVSGPLVLAPAALHGEAIEPDEALTSRLQHIENAFRNGDASALRASFVASGKVRAELKGFTNGQTWYGPGQLQVIFGQLFEEFQTREFAFRKSDVTLSSPGTAFARSRWVRRGRRGGPEVADTLTLTLHAETNDWRILEIRSSR
jgi:SnoaL-like domain